MIKSFKDSETEKIYHRERSRKLPSDIQQVALRKLRMIKNAINLNDLRIPQQIIMRNWPAIEKVNIALGSMTSGVSVLNCKAVMHLMLK